MQCANFVEVCIGVAPHCGYFFVARKQIANWCNAVHHVAKHIFVWVKNWFLLKHSNREPWGQARFAGVAVVNAGHDAQQAGFTAAVRTNNANFRARVERQRNVFKNRAVGWVEAGKFVTRIYEFSSHDAYKLVATARRRAVLVLKPSGE